MHKNSGFTIMELMTTIAIIALLATIAVPNMIGWRSKTKLQGVVENLRGDMKLAKLKAVQENGSVAVLFSANGYQVFTDDGATQEGAFHPADNERRFRNRELPAGVSMDLANFTGLGGNVYARFNNRGLPENPGTVVVNSSGGRVRNIVLNPLGHIDIIILNP